MTSDSAIRPVEHLYRTFGRYTAAGEKFCPCCYDPDEWREISGTPPRLLSVDRARKLLWETADHWESADVYKHYLPRVLEVMLPPLNVEPLYPLHVSETLVSLRFHEWPENERNAVIEYLEFCARRVTWLSGEKDDQEWSTGVTSLRQRRPWH